MKQSLKSFKHDLLESVHNFLWRQWSALGVQGYASGADAWVIDPEALLLFSITLGRYDPRLFDETMDWLDTHGHWIHIQRLRRMLNEEAFASGKLLSCIASIMAERGTESKWKRLATDHLPQRNPEPLFYSTLETCTKHFGVSDAQFEKYGFQRGPLEFRGHTQSISIMQPTGLLFKLRSLIGVNARAEIILYLLTHESGHPRKIARESYYFQKTVQDALVEMSGSGIIKTRQNGKEKHYYLQHDDWYTMLQIIGPKPYWITWAPLFKALELILLTIHELHLADIDELMLSAELRKLMQTIRPKIEIAGFGNHITDDKHYRGKAYIPVFMQDINKLLAQLNAQ